MNPAEISANGSAEISVDLSVDTSEARLGFGIDPRHKGRFALGILVVCFAQFLFLQRNLVVFNFAVTTWIQQTFFLDVPTPGNRLGGVIFLLVSAVLIWKSLRAPKASPPRQPLPAPPANDLLRQPVPLIRFLRRNLVILGGIAILMAYLLSQLASVDTAVGPVIIWILIILLMIWLARSYDKDSGARLALHIDRADVIAMIALFAVGLAISSYQLADIPKTYNDDEPEFLFAMNKIVQGQEQRSFFAPGVFDFPLASNFWQSLSFSLLGVSLWSWRFSSVFSGMLALFPMYILAREMFNRRTALLAGVLLITLPYFIAFNRLGYNNSQSLFPTALALCFLYLGLERRSLLYVALGGVAAGLGFYTYTGARVGLVIAVLFFAYLFLGKFYGMLRSPRSSPERTEARHQLFGIFAMGSVYVLVALAVFVPQMVFASTVLPELTNPKVMDNFLPNLVYARAFYPESELFRDYPAFQVAGQTFFFRPDIYLTLFLRGFILTVLAFHDGMVADLNFILGPLTGLVSAAFYGIGLVIAFKMLRDRRYVLLLLWIGSAMFFLSMIDTDPPRQTHLVAIIPALPIITAVGLLTVIEFLGERIRSLKLLTNLSLPRPRLGEALVTFVLLAIIIAPNLHNYFVDVPPFYPPEIEHVMVWGALDAPVPRTLIFANSFVDPRWQGLVLRVSDAVNMPSKFVKVDIEDLVQSRYHFMPSQEYVIYCFQYDWARIEPYMHSLPSSRMIVPVFHYTREGDVFAVEFTFDAPADMPAPKGSASS